MHAVYAYHPLSLWSLEKLLDFEMFGEMATVQRYQARMLWAGAVGVHFDKDVLPMFGKQLDDIYKSPFRRHERADDMTGEQIVAHLIGG